MTVYKLYDCISQKVSKSTVTSRKKLKIFNFITCTMYYYWGTSRKFETKFGTGFSHVSRKSL